MALEFYPTVLDELGLEHKVFVLDTMANPGFVAACLKHVEILSQKLGYLDPTAEGFVEEYSTIKNARDFWDTMANYLTDLEISDVAALTDGT